ncbi:MAG: RNA polymerase factor sigma-32 [Bacteriovoracia bacterium]
MAKRAKPAPKKTAKPRAAKKTAPKLRAKRVEVLPAEGDDLDEVDAELTDEDLEPTIDAGGSSDPVSENNDASLTQLPEISKRAVSPNDPLKRYMEEVQRYALLTPEQEAALVGRMLKQGDVNAAKMLVSANLRLVVKIAFEYRSMYANILDLIQEGNVGLMKAVSKFDPTKGARLGYYASWWIRSYILKYLLDNFRLVKVGTTQAQKKLFYHLMREKQRLEAQGILAGPKLLADRLDVREKDVIEMEQRLGSGSAEMSLDAPMDPESRGGSFLEKLTDEAEGADDRMAHQELLEVLKRELPVLEEKLNDKELKILRDRILAEEPKTLQEVADLYGLTRERVRQIEAGIVQKLRQLLKPAIE